jgi:hypothetical protein
VVQLFEAAQGAGSLLFAVIGIVYFSLIAVVAITAVFASKPTRRKAALEVLRVCYGFVGERLHVWTAAAVESRDPGNIARAPECHTPPIGCPAHDDDRERARRFPAG